MMRYKLVVADSSVSVQKAVHLAFPEDEFDIFPFENGAEVMKNLGTIQPDAILLSLSLPGKDVCEIGFYLKSQEEFKNASIFFLRGFLEPLDEQKIASVEYDEIVTKPFDSGKLAQKVRASIEKKRNPLTIPEEQSLDDVTSKEQSAKDEAVASDEVIAPGSDAGEMTGETSAGEEKNEAFKKHLKKLIDQHLETAGKDMEERIRGRLFQDVKEFFEKEVDELKQKLRRH